MNKSAGQFSSQRRLIGARGMRPFLYFCLMLALVPPRYAKAAGNSTRPKVRAITAFIHLDRAKYEEQIQDTLKMLHAARKAMEESGYEVESIRITTQPFPEYILGLSKDQALDFF